MNIAVLLIVINAGAIVAAIINSKWSSRCPHCEPIPKGEFNIEELNETK